jgi:hypothetical protein
LTRCQVLQSRKRTLSGEVCRNVRPDTGVWLAHLGYTPSEASVDNADARIEDRTVTWRVNQPGVFALFTRGQNNDASYVGCGVLP